MKAVVLGSTGAVGTALTRELLANPRVEGVTLVVRRPHPEPLVSGTAKVSQVVADPFQVSSYLEKLAGHDVAFSTFGVGEPSKVSKEEFVQVDLEAVRAFAKACRESGVAHFSSLGAIGASRDSRIFYLRIKGQLEQALIDLKFERVSLFRPCMILTPANRYGLAQGILLKVYPKVDRLFVGSLDKYRGVRVEDLGRSMARNAMQPAQGSVEFLEWRDFRRILT